MKWRDLKLMKKMQTRAMLRRLRQSAGRVQQCIDENKFQHDHIRWVADQIVERYNYAVARAISQGVVKPLWFYNPATRSVERKWQT